MTRSISLSATRARLHRPVRVLAASLALAAAGTAAASTTTLDLPGCETPAAWALTGNADEVGFVQLDNRCVLRVTGKGPSAAYSVTMNDLSPFSLFFQYSVIDSLSLSGSDNKEGLRVDALGVTGLSGAQFTLNSPTIQDVHTAADAPLTFAAGSTSPAEVVFKFSDTSGVGFYLYDIQIGSLGGNTSADPVVPSAVPEPASAWLVALGLLAMGAGIRRQQAR